MRKTDLQPDCPQQYASITATDVAQQNTVYWSSSQNM